MSHKVNIVLGATSMEITPLPTVSNSTEYLNKKEIVSIIPVKRQVKPLPPEDEYWKYPYPTMTSIEVNLSNGDHLNIELQDVANQPTWNTGSLAALNAAVAAINAWL